MRAYSDEQIQELVEEAFAAGQENMRNRAMLRAYHSIGIETGGENLPLAKQVASYLSGMRIFTTAEVRARRSAPEQDPFSTANDEPARSA